MSLENPLQIIAEMEQNFNKIKREAFEQMKVELSKIFKNFLDNNPEINSIFWTQYTPYFNDGSECVFSVNDLFYTLKVDDDPDSYEGSNNILWTYNYYKNSGKYNTEVERAKSIGIELLERVDTNFKVLKKTFGMLPDDLMKFTFGDHVKITVTTNISDSGISIEVDQYDHD